MGPGEMEKRNMAFLLSAFAPEGIRVVL